MIHALIMIAAMSMPGHLLAARGDYQYDASTGTCHDAAGIRGYNVVDLDELFTSREGAPGEFPARSAECVDFSGVTFGDYIGLEYPIVKNWNFAGANFTRAVVSFVKIVDADLRGVDLTGLTLSYGFISGTVDEHTRALGVCRLDRMRVTCLH